MDFFALPDNVFLQLFLYLPLKECIRAARVNSAFLRISNMVISSMKVLRVSPSVFGDRFEPRDLSALLNSCATNLEVFWSNSSSVDLKRERSFLEAFAQLRCPKLLVLECSFGDEQLLHAVLTNNPNLRELIVADFINYPEITSENLETVRCWCEDEGFWYLTGRVPNLKRFTVNASFEWPPTAFAQFLYTVPDLKSLRITTIGRSGLHLERGDRSVDHAFWQFESLLVLIIIDQQVNDRSSVGDGALANVAKSFPLLRILSTPVSEKHGVFTDRGLASLSSLRSLRELTLECKFKRANRDLSGGAIALTKCERLRKLRFPNRFPGFGVRVSMHALVDLLHSCRRLWQVELAELVKVRSADQAAVVIRSLAGLGEKKKKEMRLKFNSYKSIWESKGVQEAMKKLQREDGMVVKCPSPHISDEYDHLYSTDDDEE